MSLDAVLVCDGGGVSAGMRLGCLGRQEEKGV